MVDLLDRAAHNTMVRTSQADLRDVDRKGLLWLVLFLNYYAKIIMYVKPLCNVKIGSML